MAAFVLTDVLYFIIVVTINKYSRQPMISLKSKITRDVLSYFILHDTEELYVNDMARRFGIPSGNLTVKLLELEKEGILKSRWQGQQRYYGLNKQFALLKEYSQIIKKTIGFEETLRHALASIKGVEVAYIYGSYAKNKMVASSDIDLLIVGDFKSLEFNQVIADVQRRVDREINTVQLSVKEFKDKKITDPFLKRILSDKPIKII